MGLIFSNSNRGKPLTAEETAMGQTIAEALALATDIPLSDIIDVLNNLSEAELAKLFDAISIAPSAPALESQILSSVQDGGVGAVHSLRSFAPALALGALGVKPITVDPTILANMDFKNIANLKIGADAKAGFNLKFDRTNPNSLAFAQARAGQLITSIDGYTQVAIRDIITNGFAQQVAIPALAAQIKNVIGLHPQWAQAVVNYQQNQVKSLLDAGLGDVAARSKAQDMTTKYADNLRGARATMIARTEVQIAQNQGRYDGWQQANDAGIIDATSTKTWIVAKDERTCPDCMELDGETVGWEDDFSSGETMPPLHPNCRCTAVINPPDRGTGDNFPADYANQDSYNADNVDMQDA